MDTGSKQWRNAFLLLAVIALVVVAYFYVMGMVDTDSDSGGMVQLETLEDVFIDVDGDGNLDFVHSVEFVRQRVSNEDINPYPAPSQSGQ